VSKLSSSSPPDLSSGEGKALLTSEFARLVGVLSAQLKLGAPRWAMNDLVAVLIDKAVTYLSQSSADFKKKKRFSTRPKSRRQTLC